MYPSKDVAYIIGLCNKANYDVYNMAIAVNEIMFLPLDNILDSRSNYDRE